jgi:hypothetical protein
VRLNNGRLVPQEHPAIHRVFGEEGLKEVRAKKKIFKISGKI